MPVILPFCLLIGFVIGAVWLDDDIETETLKKAGKSKKQKTSGDDDE